MTQSDPPPLTVARPGEGQTGFLGSIGVVVFKAVGHTTGGAVAVRDRVA